MKTLEEKKVFVKFYDNLKEQFEIHKPEYEAYKAEISELEKQSEPQPLSFLKLAEKYDSNGVYHTLIDLEVESELQRPIKLFEKVSNFLWIGDKQARKFVAEIYLTLLAKELNGDSYIVDYANSNQDKWEVSLDEGCLRVNNCPNQNFGTIKFRTMELAKISLTYSPEAITMWNWYFGKEDKQ